MLEVYAYMCVCTSVLVLLHARWLLWKNINVPRLCRHRLCSETSWLLVVKLVCNGTYLRSQEKLIWGNSWWRVSSWSLPHSRPCFLAPSSKLCHNWLCHWRGVPHLHAAIHLRCQHALKGLGTNKTVEATWRRSTHINIRRVCPSNISFQTLVLFVMAYAVWAVMKEMPDMIQVTCYKHTAVWAPRVWQRPMA